MKYFKDDGKTNIDGRKQEDISLQVALQEVDNLSPDDIRPNFIGFINGKEETIQFIRQEQESWLIDVPVLENGKFSYSLHDTDLTTEKVKEVVKKFYLEENWRTLCNLKK